MDPLYNIRGEDFPPYSSSRNTRDSRKTRLWNSDIAYKPTDFLKHQYAPKNQWDGTIGTFRAYKQGLEGFYIQNNASFLFNPSFQSLYCEFGLDRVIGHPDLPISLNLTRDMLISARQHLFGSIQISTRKSVTIHKYLNKYRDTLDGILVWVSLVREKDNDGNIEVQISNLLHKAQRPFHSKYPGGLLKYVNDLESIYAELDMLDATVDPSDKLRSLLRQLDSMNTAITDLLS